MNKTRREYAIELGLAKPGRGKLSALAHEAINAARANGITFSDDNPAVTNVSLPRMTKDDKPSIRESIKVVGPKSVANTVAKPDYDPRAVRAWAMTQDGLTVGARGALPADIVQAYCDAHPDAQRPESVSKGVRADKPRVSMPRTRPEREAWILTPVGHRSVPVAFDTCASCTQHVSRCSHDMPIAPKYLGTGNVTLFKPKA